TDRKGNRVPGLKASDFRLMVDGRQVPLDYFTEVEDGQTASPAETVEPAEPPAPASASATAPASPAAAVSAGKAGISYLVFVDETFAVASDRNLMLKLLARDLPVGSGDRMAIVAFDGRKLDLLKDWTGDREDLRQTLGEIQSRASQGLEKLVKRELAAEDGSGPGAWEDLLGETRSAAKAAAAAMRGVSSPPGRKVLLLISGGWPSLPRRPLLTFPGGSEKGGAGAHFSPVRVSETPGRALGLQAAGAAERRRSRELRANVRAGHGNCES